MRLPLTGSEPVDELLEQHPRASSWLARRGVVCTECGEPFWGSLAELCASKGIETERFGELLAELNALLRDSS
jgi:hypothetical protein